MKRLILIDAHAIIHRAYHALPALTTPAGEAIHAVYGFTTILLKILRELKPDYIVAAFDLATPTFRHIAYERYKATRPATPSDLAEQFAKVREVLNAFGIPVLEQEGYEADDIIGTIAQKLAKERDLEVVVVTGDLDTLQLVRPRLKVWTMKRGMSDTAIYDAKAVRLRYGLAPGQLADLKGLKGDPSDNIPGVKGIGEKTAIQLLKKFGSIEAMYRALEKGKAKISASVAARLRQGEKEARFSKDLATIRCDLDIAIDLEAMRCTGGEREEQEQLFRKFGFMSLLGRMEKEGMAEEVRRARAKREPASSLLIRALRTSGDFQEFARGEVGLVLHEGALFLVRKEDRAVGVLDSALFFKEERAVQSFLVAAGHTVYDAKSIIRFLGERNVSLGEVKFDLLLAAYVAGEVGRDLSFVGIAARELGRLVALDPQEEFSHFFDVAASLEAKLKEGKLWFVFSEIELPLPPILAAMEERGVRIEPKALQGLAARVDERLAHISREIHEDAGEVFNINSPRQLSRILFDTLKIATRGLRKTAKGGAISTGAAELEKLRGAHPVIPKILEYRELAKLKSTYTDVLPQLADQKTGRLHSTFNQVGTATGRLSSSGPNLQNIPIMSELGREIRKAFVAEPGFLLVSFDYSQVELRVAAHIANDEKMIAAFEKGLDIHTLTASEIYNVPLDKVTPELRRAAKTLNFGVLYGMGPNALAQTTGMTREEAGRFIEEYFHDFAGIRDYVERTKRITEEQGYVETIFGRRRYIPEIRSPNWQIKREAERMAVNHPIQGSATGDIIKLAMIEVAAWIKKQGLGEDVRLLLTVHDELLFEIREDLMAKTAPAIKEIMEQVTKLKVPLVVDVRVGRNWGEQK